MIANVKDARFVVTINPKPLTDFLALIEASGELPDHVNLSRTGLIDVIRDDCTIWIFPSARLLAMFPGLEGAGLAGSGIGGAGE